MIFGHRGLLVLAMLLLMQQARGSHPESDSIPAPGMQVDPAALGAPPDPTRRAMFYTTPAELREELAVHEILPQLYAGAQLEGYSSYEKHGGPANTDTSLDSISGALRWVPFYGLTGLYEGSYDLQN